MNKSTYAKFSYENNYAVSCTFLLKSSQNSVLTANIFTGSETIKDIQDFLYSNLRSFYRSSVSLSGGMSHVWWKSTAAGSKILRVNCLRL